LVPQFSAVVAAEKMISLKAAVRMPASQSTRWPQLQLQ
jgi:hypothetical protein